MLPQLESLRANKAEFCTFLFFFKKKKRKKGESERKKKYRYQFKSIDGQETKHISRYSFTSNIITRIFDNFYVSHTIYRIDREVGKDGEFRNVRGTDAAFDILSDVRIATRNDKQCDGHMFEYGENDSDDDDAIVKINDKQCDRRDK
ncbi:hypothetical protein RFI_04176 [Reticulomyxa filosa]|uniref:Uncharacterized protein n=1 Tax=Reticulomyxa filosa TaxID=46433 RepID=X6P5Q3_RETFI|nr:hypothetical protein RFI_04176 [Reticulomyxa filosa]|eukprot:ETO32932.1 hypothetical protein RFI_04176 [Reticulomyxa filosa]